MRTIEFICVIAFLAIVVIFLPEHRNEGELR